MRLRGDTAGALRFGGGHSSKGGCEQVGGSVGGVGGVGAGGLGGGHEIWGGADTFGPLASDSTGNGVSCNVSGDQNNL